MRHDVEIAGRSPLWTAVRWIAVVISLGIVIMAILIGQGVWGGERDLIPGHGHLGNALFALSVVELVLLVVLYRRQQVSAALILSAMILTGLLVAQLGLGYSGRTNSGLIAWHVPLGVLAMGLSTFNAAFIWLRSAITTIHDPRPAA